jgi:simple sugar transport system permease protein
MNLVLITGLAVTTVALATPLMLAALGEVVVEKAGTINVGIEGMMLTGAFVAYVAAAEWHSAMLGLLAAVGSGVALALLFGLVTLVFEADQVVVGTAVNIFALGLTGVLYRGLQADLPPLDPGASFAPISIPVLCHIPVLGQALFCQNALGYIAFVLPPICAWYLSRTRPGLALRAAGEHPAAADSAGFSVNRLRLLALMFGSALASVAGAYLSIAYTTGFAQGMSGGKGFIALAVVIVGRWSPMGIVAGALLFGAASSAQFGFQASNAHIPYQLLLALPYVLTLAALIWRSGRVSAPASLGAPFKRA